MKEAPAGDATARLKFAFETCVGRPPAEEELAILTQLYSEFRSLADADHDAAAKLVGASPPPETELADTAAAVALARVLLNLDEFVTRE
jgi:hypothetical protein